MGIAAIIDSEKKVRLYLGRFFSSHILQNMYSRQYSSDKWKAVKTVWNMISIQLSTTKQFS